MPQSGMAHPFGKLQAVGYMFSENFRRSRPWPLWKSSRTHGGTALRSDMCNEIEKAQLRLRAEMNSMRADIQAEFRKFYWYFAAFAGVMVCILKFT